MHMLRLAECVEAFRADPTRPLVFDGKLVELATIRRLEVVVGSDAA